MENNINPIVGMPVQSSKVGMIALSVGLLVVGLVAGYMFGRGGSENTVVPTYYASPDIRPTDTPIVSSSPSPSTPVTVNWKTYNGTGDIKFNLKYPSSWNVDTSSGDQNGYYKGVTFGHAPVGDVLSFQWNFPQPISASCAGGKMEQVQLMNQKIAMCHYSGSSQQPEQYRYVSTQNGIQYVLSVILNQANKTVILELLATLKLGDSVTTLKNYQNTTYGISFRYTASYTKYDGAYTPSSYIPIPANYFERQADTIVTIAIPKSAFPGTTFLAGYFRVAVSGVIGTEELCRNVNLPTGESVTLDNTQTVNGTSFYTTITSGGQSNNNFSARIYRIFQRETCFEVSMYENINGGIDAPSIGNRAFAKMQSIFDSLTIRN